MFKSTVKFVGYWTAVAILVVANVLIDILTWPWRKIKTLISSEA